MQYRELGRTGWKVSASSFGAWAIGSEWGKVKDEESIAALHKAVDMGVNFFDTADMYSLGVSEEVTGRALRDFARREDVVIATKVFFPMGDGPNRRGLSRKHIIEGTDASLKRLDLDYVDLLFCHRADPTTPIEETVRAMHNIIERGKALYWGTSEWEATEIQDAIDVAERYGLHKPVVEQPVYNLFERHRFGDAYRHIYEEQGYGSTTWSPLASGTLTGKYQQGVPEGSRGSLESLAWLRDQITDAGRLARVAALEPLAQEMGATLAQFSLAWCLQNPWVSTVITGASRVEQVHENMKAVEFIDRFTPEVVEAIDRIFS